MTDDAPSETPQKPAQNPTAEDLAELAKRRQSVRLTTVYGGRISQFGKAYPCTISDISVGGAKVKLKDPRDFGVLVKDQSVQLVFDRLSDYKALNGELAWMRPSEFVVGMTFSDPELRRRMVLKRLMPNRWRIANEHAARHDTEGVPSEDI
ncbi:PilZ domain-containing protein [Magnetovibrio sp.]|uniref:PilZ domain-containing protein n=1 Tax=Magnetovibrio sp. TaxID=2024836 RepID=UPI002F943179